MMFRRNTLPSLLLLSMVIGWSAACQSPGAVVEVTRQVEIEVTRPVLFEREVEVTREVAVTRVVDATPVDVEAPTDAGEPAVGESFGTAERPFQLVFLPGNPVALINVRGGFLIDYLTQETGYLFEAVAPATAEEALTAICDRPQETIAVLDPETYISAVELCQPQIIYAATRFDLPVQLGMMVARQDRVINVVEDLAAKTVAVPSLTDLATYGWFAADLAARGIEVAEFIEVGSSSAALLAVLNEEVDVATADYNPPILPNEARLWEYGVDSPEIWRQIEVSPERDPIGYVDVAGGPEFGGYRIRDERAALFDDYPEIFDETKIVLLSAPIPNEAVVLGRDFPYAAALKIIPALAQFATSEECAQSVCASDFYHWDGMAPVDDQLYDVWRADAAVVDSDAEDAEIEDSSESSEGDS